MSLPHLSKDRVIYWEIYFLFQNAFNNEYEVLFFKCSSNRSIIIPKEDIDFFGKKAWSFKDIFKTLSEDAWKIKNLQYYDFMKIYDISLKDDRIGAFFIIPKLDENIYCYDFFLVVKSNFNLNEFLRLKFNLVTIYSVINYNKDTLDISIISKLYNS